MKYTAVIVANEPNPVLSAGLASHSLTFHLRQTPKALLPSWKPDTCILDLWWEEIKSLNVLLSDTYLVVNAAESKPFTVWAAAAGFPLENIINDGSSLPCNTVGPMGAVALAVRSREIQGPVCVVLGDAMIPPSDAFSLRSILSYYATLNTSSSSSVDVIAARPLPLLTSHTASGADGSVIPSTPEPSEPSPSFVVAGSTTFCESTSTQGMWQEGQHGGGAGCSPCEFDVVAARALVGASDRTHVKMLGVDTATRSVMGVDPLGTTGGHAWWAASTEVAPSPAAPILHDSAWGGGGEATLEVPEAEATEVPLASAGTAPTAGLMSPSVRPTATTDMRCGPVTSFVGVVGGMSVLTPLSVRALVKDYASAQRALRMTSMSQLKRQRSGSSKPAIGRSSQAAVMAAPRPPTRARGVEGLPAGIPSFAVEGPDAPSADDKGGASSNRRGSASQLGSYIVPDVSADGLGGSDTGLAGGAASTPDMRAGASPFAAASVGSTKRPPSPSPTGAVPTFSADDTPRNSARTGEGATYSLDPIFSGTAEELSAGGDVVSGTSWDEIAKLGPQAASRGLFGPPLAAFLERLVQTHGATVRCVALPAPLLLQGQATFALYVAALSSCLAADAARSSRTPPCAVDACHRPTSSTAVAAVISAVTEAVGGSIGVCGGIPCSGSVDRRGFCAPKNAQREQQQREVEGVALRVLSLLATATPMGRPEAAQSSLQRLLECAAPQAISLYSRLSSTQTGVSLGTAGRRGSASGADASVAPRSVSASATACGGGSESGSVSATENRVSDLTSRGAVDVVASALATAPSSDLKAITRRAYARVGLLGNPSDGFGGQTLSVPIHNFYAEVTLQPRSDGAVVFRPSLIHDRTEFATADALCDAVAADGFDGGVRLLQAAAKSFYKFVNEQGFPLRKSGYEVSYDTSIPRRVGLAGSSAIVTAMFRCLLAHYRISVGPEGIPLQVLPSLILAAEKDFLGITAGLQDRVAQVYDTLVDMDFGTPDPTYPRAGGTFRAVSSTVLPPGLWMAWTTLGSDSGRVHSDVRARFDRGDDVVRRGMQDVAALVSEGLRRLEGAAHDVTAATTMLGELMSRNLSLRLMMYGEQSFDHSTRRLLKIAHEVGVPVKLPGSGCAVVGVSGRRAGGAVCSDAKRATLRAAYEREGFVFADIVPRIKSDV